MNFELLSGNSSGNQRENFFCQGAVRLCCHIMALSGAAVRGFWKISEIKGVQ
jgi:hypothetical protein